MLNSLRQGPRNGRIVFREIQRLTVEIGSETAANDQRQSTGRESSARTQRRSETATRVQHSAKRGINYRRGRAYTISVKRKADPNLMGS